LIDFHTHTIFSDGVLVPSELVRRAHVIGYTAIGLTDHVDASNLEFVAPRIIRVARELNKHQDVFVIPGVEITHAPPSQIEELVLEARNIGIVLVVVHGESPVEPVMSGTNHAAIISGADILAHPGLISREDAVSAREKHVFLEITCRSGHSFTNGHVYKMASDCGAQMVISTDTHIPENLATREKAEMVLRGAGMNSLESANVFDSNRKLLEILKARMDW